MDQMRSAFNGVVKSVRYSRFTLQPTDSGERHAEVKLSDDGTEEITEVEAGGSPSFRPALPNRSRRSIAYLVLGTLLIFITGYLVGYFIHRKYQVESVNCSPPRNETAGKQSVPTQAPGVQPPDEVEMDFKTISQLLAKKMTKEAFEKTLRRFDLPNRSAGSDEDMSLANRIFDGFKELEMDPWTDIHYVQLPMADRQKPNKVQFGAEVFNLAGFLAYSVPGRVQGKLVYGNYGRKEDLDVVQKNNVELKGCVLLVRAGKISFAEQVDNAGKKGASAVLIFPDFEDYEYQSETALYGHVHLGSGDPYTPGFPSFNHTQFPPTQSSGLPKILAQTITCNIALKLIQKIGGPEPDAASGFKGSFKSVIYSLGGVENITVEVNNVLVNKELHNVFGVIKGFDDPDRYIVLGAQRDAWGSGYTRATVGTSVLTELAKAFHEMVENDGFRPRRSLVFASWSAGEYGSIGATEWLEGYMASIDKSVFTYISLDGVVMGKGGFMASASPLLYSLLETTMKEVNSPFSAETMYNMAGKTKWEANVMRPMTIDDPAYPFLAFSGIPSVSFHFITPNSEVYTYYGTHLDNVEQLSYKTNQRTGEITVAAAQFAGQMALHLVHDHLLSLDMNRYSNTLTKAVVQVYRHIQRLSQSGKLKDLSPNWLNRARGSFQRAARGIYDDIASTNLDDKEACRILNDRIMRVEHNLLSPYVSPVEVPFRHLLFGRGSHTLASISEATDMDELRTQLALATWNLQGCANAMVGDIWDLDEEI
ncbi:transferrin receptor 1b [Archocentrus centrarchus]|uniref:transferrin receptor 1b n=1 Tax=Archocentrus centrarchus TaxID=63155 RepID=UPI0011EA0DB3|nr:transferrin receptor protein 1-like [Archocentrus centrarchus]XP_030612493.1 transferrin receptor protein 1-like [Archocentrus centrarchus]